MTEPMQPTSGAVIEVDPLAKELGERFDAAGHQLYVVGGSVRDLILGRPRPDADIDFCTDAAPADTTRILRGWAERQYLVGVRFGTVGALKGDRRLEVTTFREDVYVPENRKPAVTFAKDIETDLSRRDFTINAMAVRVPAGEFVDPFGGVRHLASKVLDTPLEPEVSFGDDPLRMLRAARFVAQLEVVPTERVVEAIEEMGERLRIVSAERIADELNKLLVAPAPSRVWNSSSPPVSRMSSSPSCRRSAWSRTLFTGTRTCCATRSPSSSAASPTPRCGSRPCSTTSASRRPGRSPPRGSSSIITRSWGPGWPTRGFGSFAIPTPWSTTW